MTLPTSLPVVVLQGDGNNTSFPFSFPITDIAHVVVTITDTTQTPSVITSLNYGTEFSISGMPCPNGGTITYPYPSGTPLPVGSCLTIRRVVPYAQSTSIVNQSGFYPEILEGALDYLTMQTQQLAEQSSRSVQVPIGSGIDPTAYMTTLLAQGKTTADNAAIASAAATTAENFLASLASQSTTSLTIGTGSQSLTVGTGLKIQIGQFITLANTALPANYMHGQVTTYDSHTGALTINVSDVGGSGAFSNWILSIAGTQGPQGPQGNPGAGNVTGPPVSTDGSLAIWNGTNGAALADGPSYGSGSVANQILQLNSSGVINPAALGNGAASASTVLFGNNIWGSINVNSVPVRQTVLAGDVDANNRAAFLTTGTGLTPSFTTASGQLVMTFANGFGANGSADLVTRLTASGNLSAVPAGSTSYLYANYVSPTSVTWGSTLLPPQYGQAFDPQGYGLYHMEGSGLTDDYGNTNASNTSGTFSTAQAKFGTQSWLGGSGAYYWINTIPVLAAPYTIELWAYIANTATTYNLFQVGFGNGSYGTLSLQYGGSGSGQHSVLGASSAGTAWDVANGVVGSGTAISTTGWHHFAVTWDGMALRAFVDGNLDVYVATATKLQLTGARATILGYNTRSGGATSSTGCYYDEVRISPGVRYPTATTTPGAAVFTPPVTAFTADGNFFNTAQMQMYSISGAGPSFTQVQRLYVGECVAGASSITSVISYALQGRYISPWTSGMPSAGTAMAIAHYLGITRHEVHGYLRNRGESTGNPNLPLGAVIPWVVNGNSCIIPVDSMLNRDRNLDTGYNGNNQSIVYPAVGGSWSAGTAANWDYMFEFKRGW